MAPATRSRTKRNLDITGITATNDADEGKPPKKKHVKNLFSEGSTKKGKVPEQKTMSDDYAGELDHMDVDIPVPPRIPFQRQPVKTNLNAKKVKNVHLKGRKRFMADLEDLKTGGLMEAYGLGINSIRPGDEEGAVEVTVMKNTKNSITFNLLIDDTSYYPREHTFYSFVHDDGIPPHILQIFEELSSASPKPLENTVRSIMASISASLSTNKYVSPQEAQNEAYEGDGNDYGYESDETYEAIDYELGNGRYSTVDEGQTFKCLKTHFLEIIATDYKPGLFRISDQEIVISVSCPVAKLGIPPRALVAWDRRLLASFHNLTLLISDLHPPYPTLSASGALLPGATPKFHVGLTPRYKPSRENVLQTVRNFSIVTINDKNAQDPKVIDVANDPGRFENFSLSASLESALEDAIPLLQLRLKYKIGWAGAEVLYTHVKQSQTKPEDIIKLCNKEIIAADNEEVKLTKSYNLPVDPLFHPSSGPLNLPFIAYSYLVRRFKLCPRYCLVCHRKIQANFEALKPYVCDDKLCTYQYYALNFGPSIEYEICTNPTVVDLLVSLAYLGAYEHQVNENLPVGLGIRVPVPKALRTQSQSQYNYYNRATPVADNIPAPKADPDGMVEFDDLPLPYMRAAIVELIESLPSISEMKAHLMKFPGKVAPQLRTMDENVSPAAWLILRWCVASSTAYLEEITEPDDKVCNISNQWRQFRFSVGAPDKEARYKQALTEIQKKNENAKQYPALYAFHGSPMRNWHSIIRQGLLVKEALHGRAYGHGVYFAKDGTVSMGTYATTTSLRWSKSEIAPLSCLALAEIINSPQDFTSKDPYYVVAQVDWILCRYLLVKQGHWKDDEDTPPDLSGDVEEDSKGHYITLDPTQPLTVSQKTIRIPEYSHKLDKLLEARLDENPEDEPFDEEDRMLLSGNLCKPPLPKVQSEPVASSSQMVVKRKADEDWKHNEAWCSPDTYQLLPPPTDSTPGAGMAIQRELKAMLKEQEHAVKTNSLCELGWFLPPELMDDNLFRWMVELHSCDPSLPIQKDMASQEIPSVLFEIRFPDRFPNQPPFFRVIKPRLLPFAHGGGGHVTAGGSICMDLLTSDGWLPSYSIAAVLLQIKLAISNLDPKPARLAKNWEMPYAIGEALEGYKRAAALHGWKIPEDIERLVR